MTRVDDLAGAELDAWVARTLGWKLFYMEPGQLWYTLFEQPDGGEGPVGTVETGAIMFDDFQPSTDWSQGGPLIEKHGIPIWNAAVGLWQSSAKRLDDDERIILLHGATALIAAMRALVASVYGEEVES